MNASKAFRMLILLISFMMFIWQASVAVGNLMDQPVVDLTERFSIADIDPLLITICPLEQWDYTELQQYGYYHEQNLLNGFNSLGTMAWGAQYNLTFEELVSRVSKYNLSESDMSIQNRKVWKNAEYEIRFYPMHGYCYDLVNISTSGELKIHTRYPQYQEAVVYITDKKLRTKNTVFAESHWGSKIILQKGLRQEFVVKVEQLSHFDPRDPDDCKEYDPDAYEKCIDDELQKVWKPMINCNPPWLSPKDQCDNMINVTVTQIEIDKMVNTGNGIFQMTTYPAKESCTKPCTVTQPNIFFEYEGKAHYHLVSSLVLNFGNQVVYTSKKLAYGPSDFLIDMGSSLGLWFGLSVFGITDLGIMAFQWVKKIRHKIMRKFMK